MTNHSNNHSVRFLTMDQLISRLVRTIGSHVSQRKWDVVEWVGELMQFTNAGAGPTGIQHEDLSIANYRALLPWNCLTLLAVSYNNCRLPYSATPLAGDSQLLPDFIGDDPIASSSPLFIANPDGVNDLDYTNTFKEYKKTKSLKVSSDDFYQLQGDNVVTSFSEGKVRIHYYGILTCPQKLPVVPNVFEFIEAIRWFTLRNLIDTGYRHPSYNAQYCEQMFEKRLAQGLNTMVFPSPDEMQLILRSWLRLIDEYQGWESYNINNHANNRLI